jgi:hypothetical protein
MLETDSKSQYVPSLAGGSGDLNMITRLNEFAAGHIPASARGSLEMAIARIRYNVQIGTHLADIDRWIATAPAQGADDCRLAAVPCPGRMGVELKHTGERHPE